MQNRNPLLSVVIPVYNVEQFIDECVYSIFNQGMDEDKFEIILINDGSTDESLARCHDIANRYSNIAIIDQKNAGQSAARNKGIEHAKGDYIYFIDSDDYLRSGYLGDILKLMVEDNLDFIGFQMFRTNNRLSQDFNSAEKVNIQYRYKKLELAADYNFNNGPCWYIFKKDILGDLRFVEGRYCEDGLFTAQLITKIENAVVLDNAIYGYYINPHSTVMIIDHKKNQKMIEDMLFASQYYHSIIEEVDYNNSNYNKVVRRFKERQESYLFFAFIRMLKCNKKITDFDLAIQYVNASKDSIYPIKNFRGYTIKEKLIKVIFNNRLLLKFFIYFNGNIKRFQ